MGCSFLACGRRMGCAAANPQPHTVQEMPDPLAGPPLGQMVGPAAGKSPGRRRDRPSRLVSMTDLDPLAQTAISPTHAYAANRANWDDRATVHAASRAHDL